MALTVKKLAEMSGVSVRTLHHYDATGLLKPANHGANGYRYYEEPQLLKLQQILFYRELGFGLKEIKQVVARDAFDKIAALKSHRRQLRKKVAGTERLIETIDRTIEHLKGRRRMKLQDFFVGFSPEQQAKHEQNLIERFGDGIRRNLAQSRRRVKEWTQADWQRSGEGFAKICQGMAQAIDRNEAVESTNVQSLVRKHFEWLKQFWTPNRESYEGHGHLIVDSELRKAYEVFAPSLPEFMAQAIGVFVRREWPSSRGSTEKRRPRSSRRTDSDQQA